MSSAPCSTSAGWGAGWGHLPKSWTILQQQLLWHHGKNGARCATCPVPVSIKRVTTLLSSRYPFRCMFVCLKVRCLCLKRVCFKASYFGRSEGEECKSENCTDGKKILVHLLCVCLFSFTCSFFILLLSILYRGGERPESSSRHTSCCGI